MWVSVTESAHAKAAAFQRSVRRFLEDQVAAHIDDWERQGAMPARELFAKFGDRGLLGIERDLAWGGLGLGFRFTRLFAAELGSLDCGGVGMAVTSHTDMSTPAVATHGSEEVREQYLRPAIAGCAIGAIALTEPAGGSDYASLSTWLRPVSGGYRISGKKAYITNATIADFLVVLCRSSESAEVSQALTMVVVPSDSAGVSRSAYPDKLGNRCCDHGEVVFSECFVPASHVLGGVGLGYGIQAEQFIRERLVSGTTGAAHARRLLNSAVAYSRERHVFGRRVADYQAISEAMVNIDAGLTLLDALLDRCEAAMDGNGADLGKHSLIVKLTGAALWNQAADLLMRVEAGRGYLVDSSVQRAWRDARAASIAGGTEETLRRNLAGYLT